MNKFFPSSINFRSPSFRKKFLTPMSIIKQTKEKENYTTHKLEVKKIHKQEQ